MSNIGCLFFLLCKDKQRELVRKGSLKNGNAGSPVNQQPKKNNVMARTRYKQKKTITVFTVYIVCFISHSLKNLSLFLLPSRLVVPNKGYSSLDQSPDEKPLVALDTDRYALHSSFTDFIYATGHRPQTHWFHLPYSDDDFDMSRYSSSGYSSAEVRSLREQVSMNSG